MKKNKMMRTASGLLVATLLTTSVISGTFAKYTSQDSASDTARVAKWGVVIQATGNLYGTKYEHSATNIANSSTTSVSVQGEQIAPTNNVVVAPGTENGVGMSFSINGKPEVATQVDVNVIGANVYLSAGDYGVMVECDAVTADNIGKLAANGLYISTDETTFTKVETTANAATFTANAGTSDLKYYTIEDAVTAANYYPVEYTLTGDTNASGNEDADTMGAVLTAIDNSLKTDAGMTADTSGTVTNRYTVTKYSKEFDVNKNLADLKINNTHLTWKWEFENEGTATGDVASVKDRSDTILGQMMAMTVDNAATPAGTDMKGIVVYATAGTEGTLANSYEAVKLKSDTVTVKSLNSGAAAKSWTNYYVTNQADTTIANLSTFFYVDIIATQIN